MMVRLFATGGTIDKIYDAHSGVLGFEKTQLGKMLERANHQISVAVETLFLKDSLEMDDNDRKRILAACEKCAETQILIAHGTDTMVETAKFLGARELQKTIVLFGAMTPYLCQNSDALFNLGAAVGALSLLPKDTHIAMNGKIFHWKNVRKNRRLGIFQPR